MPPPPPPLLQLPPPPPPWIALPGVAGRPVGPLRGVGLPVHGSGGQGDNDAALRSSDVQRGHTSRLGVRGAVLELGDCFFGWGEGRALVEVGVGEAEGPLASPAPPPSDRFWRPMGSSACPSSNEGSGW